MERLHRSEVLTRAGWGSFRLRLPGQAVRTVRANSSTSRSVSWSDKEEGLDRYLAQREAVRIVAVGAGAPGTVVIAVPTMVGQNGRREEAVQRRGSSTAGELHPSVIDRPNIVGTACC